MLKLTRFKGYSNDVQWFVPKYKRPIVTSTIAAADTIKYAFIEAGYKTPNQIMKAIKNGIFLGGQEEEFILKQYINAGYGDLELQLV